MNELKNKKGFTIIEVILVLAIAGLIFLMVFIALPALRKSQRDTARKNDVSLVSTAVSNYTTNNRGNFPTAANLSTYVTDISDYSKNANNQPNIIVRNTAPSGSINPQDTEIIVVRGKTCGEASNSGVVLNSGTARQYVVITKLETGNGQVFCQTN